MIENKIHNKQEQGRSMTEMLGVLAVVGVLSIGGIAGYTYARDKYYANELLTGASERAVLIMAQHASGRKASLSEFSHYSEIGGKFEDVHTDAEGFSLQVSGVKGSVCENVIKALEGSDIFIADTANKTLSVDDCKHDEVNTFVFVYKLNTGISETGEKLWTPSPCEDSSQCADECEQCSEWGECIKSQTGSCTCSDDEMEVDYDGDGVMDCIPCTLSFGMWDIDSKGCSKCPNREMNEDEYCVLKECPKGYLRDSYSECIPCDTLNEIYDLEDGECDNCPNRRMSDYGSCNLVECPDEYLFDGRGCLPCADIYPYELQDPKQCDRCPNRELEDDNICGIKCLDNYFRNKDNDCIPCDDLDSEEDVTEFQCTKKCDNREIKTTKNGREVCALKECPDRHIVDSYHGCWPCNTKYAFDSSECSDCTDREIITTKYGYEVCALKVCPSGTNRDDDGNCI